MSSASMTGAQTAREVITDIAEAGKLLADFTVQAAGSLEGAAAAQSNTLTPDEMGRRVKIAIAALKGEELAVPGKAEKLRPENQTAGRETTLNDGSHAIEMQVPVNGQTIRAVLSDSSFNKSRSDQGAYAQELGGRWATRKENRAVVDDLFDKEDKGTLNTAEKELLTTYREKYVRDSEGGLGVGGRLVLDNSALYDLGSPFIGALVVLPLAESK